MNNRSRAGVAVVSVMAALVALARVPCTSQTPEGGAGGHGSQGQLSLVVVVLDDLVPRPVPLTDFQIAQQFGERSKQVVRTDERGAILVALDPGAYTIENVEPCQFKGRLLSWKRDVVVEAGKTAQIKLTDADATETSASLARQVSDEAKVYQRVKCGVVTVECDFGRGSGFVVDQRGLVLTNQHVTQGTRWAAVRFASGIRASATVADEDKDADVAVLLFNPAACGDFCVIPLADPDRGPIAVEGEKVLAIGSPLHQESLLTTGIVSKVEPGVLMSDVNINHGNSGGPLLNLAGEAVGIATFVDPGDPNGPGISGIVAISKATEPLARARQKLATLPLPSAEALPTRSPVPVPTACLAEAATKDLRPCTIRAPKNLEALLYTPLIMASRRAAFQRELARARNKRVAKRSGEAVKEKYQFDPRRFWRHYTDSLDDAVVLIIVRPAVKESVASRWRSFFGALAGVPTQREFEFRDDFYDMELRREGKVVEPVGRHRVRHDLLYESFAAEVKDLAYGGAYLYDPLAFEPSQRVVLRMRKESNLAKWEDLELGKKIQERVWSDFACWRQAVDEARAGQVQK